MVNVLKLFERRKARTRSQIKRVNKKGRIRLSVFRSNNHIYAQLIDDERSITLASASTKDVDLKSKLTKTANIDAAKQVGELIAERGKKVKIEQVVFDKGGYIYHGRVKALADAARAGGLKF
jgi:large subunit ribosomal protein L18